MVPETLMMPAVLVVLASMIVVGVGDDAGGGGDDDEDADGVGGVDGGRCRRGFGGRRRGEKKSQNI